jgi:uncharacterized membrane protein
MLEQGATAPSATMSRTVDAGRGAAWWSEGWRLFAPAAGTWILITVVLFLVNLVLGFIPVVGHIAGLVVFPILTGGLMLGCRAVDRGEPLTINHLFAGFNERSGPLLVVGLIYCVLSFAILAVVFGVLMTFFGAAILSQLWQLADITSLTSLLGGLMLVLLVGVVLLLLLFVPLLMAIWFAPALVVLRGVEPVDALKLSFGASMKNVLSFLVYGIVGVVLAIVASIPLGLGWLILAPVTITSLYAGYCDIFNDEIAARTAVPT